MQKFAEQRSLARSNDPPINAVYEYRTLNPFDNVTHEAANAAALATYNSVGITNKTAVIIVPPSVFAKWVKYGRPVLLPRSQDQQFSIVIV
jgi:hypothetical protein